MERLTYEGRFCDIAVCMEPECKYPDTGCSQKQVWERLKAYEDTGVEPGEIKDLLEQNERAERPKPLTIDELKELEEQHEPVYVARMDGMQMFKGHRYCAAVLDRKITFGGIYDKSLFAIYGDKLTLWESGYGTSWIAYRQRPKEDGV